MCRPCGVCYTYSMNQEEQKSLIGNKAAVLLIVSAVIADLLTLIPLVGVLAGPIYWILINIYFLKAGFGLMSGKRLATSGISAVAEIVPVIQELPTITVGMIIIIITTRLQEKTGISLGSIPGKGPHLNSGGVRMPAQKQQPLNQAGIRPPNGGLKS